jgi:small subunit ribosomal protein S18
VSDNDVRKRRPTRRKKPCSFCIEKATAIDFKDVSKLRRFVTERGKIMPRRMTGNCAQHQRQLSMAVKRARLMALLPYSID